LFWSDERDDSQQCRDHWQFSVLWLFRLGECDDGSSVTNLGGRSVLWLFQPDERDDSNSVTTIAIKRPKIVPA